MALPRKFLEELPQKTDAELYDILAHKEDYLPEAVEAATHELSKRNLPAERLAQLRTAVEAQEAQTEFCRTQFPVPPRPKSVTVISWLAILSAIGQAWLVLYVGTLGIMPKTPPLVSLRGFASIALLGISGVVMLRGHNWARWAFVVTFTSNQISKLMVPHWGAYYAASNILGLLLLAAAFYFLFRPPANAFFSGTASQAHEPLEGPQQSSKATSALPQPVGEPGASPNGGPTVGSANSGAGGGPPPVS